VQEQFHSLWGHTSSGPLTAQDSDPDRDRDRDRDPVRRVSSTRTSSEQRTNSAERRNSAERTHSVGVHTEERERHTHIEREGEARNSAERTHSVGVQIRRGRWHVGSKGARDDKGLLSDEGEAQLLKCARKLARNTTRFFLVTDDETARVRASAALAPYPVLFFDTPPVHSGLEHQGDEGQRAVFLDWWLLGETADAVLSDSSSFGYAAAARAAHWGEGANPLRNSGQQGGERGGGLGGERGFGVGRLLGEEEEDALQGLGDFGTILPSAPVTVWNTDAEESGVCSRRVWKYCRSPPSPPPLPPAFLTHAEESGVYVCRRSVCGNVVAFLGTGCPLFVSSCACIFFFGIQICFLLSFSLEYRYAEWCV
jgi:hypothetical protein